MARHKLVTTAEGAQMALENLGTEPPTEPEPFEFGRRLAAPGPTIDEQIATFADQFKAVTAKAVLFPYESDTAKLITIDLWHIANRCRGLGKSKRNELNKATGGGLNRVIRIFDNVDAHFAKVINLENIFELDRFGYPNIGAFTNGCRLRVNMLVAPMDSDGTINYEQSIPGWHGVVPESEWSGAESPFKATFDADGKTYGVQPYGLMWDWDKFTVIANICAAGHEQTVRDALTRKRSDPRNRAIERGAITTLGGTLAAYSGKTLSQSLTTFAITKLPYDEIRKDTFDADGRLNQLALGDQSFRHLDDLQVNFLLAVVALVEDVIETDERDNTIEFYLPSILDELHVDPRPTSKKRARGRDGKTLEQLRVAKIIEIVRPFDLLVGCLPDGSFWRLLSLEGYDAESQTVRLSTPYLFELRRYAKKLSGPQLHRMLHSDAYTENATALELANRLIIGIVQRGSRVYKSNLSRKTIKAKGTDGSTTTTTYDYGSADEPREKHPIVTYNPRYQTIIDDCPLLKAELAEIEADTDNPHKAQDYNVRLRRAFEAAYRIIETKSDLPKCYRDLCLPKTTRKRRGTAVECYETPTKSVVATGGMLRITHRGKIPVR